MPLKQTVLYPLLTLSLLWIGCRTCDPHPSIAHWPGESPCWVGKKVAWVETRDGRRIEFASPGADVVSSASLSDPRERGYVVGVDEGGEKYRIRVEEVRRIGFV